MSRISFSCSDDYYDTTESVRQNLSQKGIPVKERERNGSMIILDIVKAIDNPYFDVPPIERLKELSKKLVKQFEDKTPTCRHVSVPSYQQSFPAFGV